MTSAQPVVAGAPPRDMRVAALRRFAVAITVLNTLGHTILGFEVSLAQLFTSLFTAYGLELLLELVAARGQDRRPRFLEGGRAGFVNFLLPAHITGLAIGMLLYTSDRLLPYAFAAAVGIASKALLTAPAGKGYRHFMNPSNFGLTFTFLVFSEQVATVVPYQYTIDLYSYGDWLLPCIVICTGSMLNTLFTRRIPLVLGWVGGFALQAVARHLFLGAGLLPTLSPMTGMAFLLFTFYMVPDPGTTPSQPRRQVLFGLSVAALYGVITSLHFGFAIFYALTVVCLVRGVGMYVMDYLALRRTAGGTRGIAAFAPTAVGSNGVVLRSPAEVMAGASLRTGGNVGPTA